MKCCPLTFLPCASNQSPPPHRPFMPLGGSNCFVCGKTPLEFLLRNGYPGEVLFGKRDGFCESFHLEHPKTARVYWSP